MSLANLVRNLVRRGNPCPLPWTWTPKLRMIATIPLCEIPETFADIELPEQRKLAMMPKIPHYYISQKPPRLRKSHYDIRGPERIQNRLRHNQYGIIALGGGYLCFEHFEVIRMTINREMDTRKMFAVWRVDPPWKPMTKRSIGKTMGGGKSGCHHYATPVKGGRIIVEVGGKIEFSEVYPMLNRVAIKLPFDSMVVSKQILDDIEKEARENAKKNINPFSFEYCIENDIRGCNNWVGEYDRIFRGKYL